MEPRSGCPINAAVEVLGDRWSLLVLRDVIFGDRRHFRELLAGSEEGIATNILASRLKRAGVGRDTGDSSGLRQAQAAVTALPPGHRGPGRWCGVRHGTVRLR